jgi:hypothetical protein
MIGTAMQLTPSRAKWMPPKPQKHFLSGTAQLKCAMYFQMRRDIQLSHVQRSEVQL